MTPNCVKTQQTEFVGPLLKNEIKSDITGVLYETDAETIDGGLNKVIEHKVIKRKYEIIWLNVCLMSMLHIVAVYGIYLAFTRAKLITTLTSYGLSILSGIGITGGAHRLWAHRSYKANLPLRILLVIANTMAFQECVITWARNHRAHHKYSETDADPHNAKRGFFFSHVGWLLVRKHPDARKKGRSIDMSDLEADPLLVFQEKYYILLLLVFWLLLPTAIPIFLWNESLVNSICLAVALRYTISLHFTWLVNSAAHLYGNKPYDKEINPSENWLVANVALGEGYHNYHHVFPWDYKTAELPNTINATLRVINFFASIGWAYDLKTVSPEIIEKRTKRTGDGTHPIWGWGDKDQSKDEIQNAQILYKKSQ